MSVVIRAAAALQPGCRLYYDCPMMSTEDYQSDQFFRKYHGKYAEFVGYCEKFAGPLDFLGRLSGRYVDPDFIKVKFDGEEEVQMLNVHHFVVVDTGKAGLRNTIAGRYARLGDLHRPVLFYQGDMVRLIKNMPDGFGDAPRKVTTVFVGKPFTTDGTPRYGVSETDEEHQARVAKTDKEQEKLPWASQSPRHLYADPEGRNVEGTDLELVERGNVWALYNDPSKLSFKSDEEEAEFWVRDGITYLLPTKDQQYLALATDILEREEWTRPVSYAPRRLHDCFSQHRDRVRALTKRLWADTPYLSEELDQHAYTA